MTLKKIFFFVFTIICLNVYSQSTGARLQIFVDCSNVFCDMDYIKTEINLVDFIRDNKDADAHILITEQAVGSGGKQYQLIFFGQKTFRNLIDTLKFITQPNNTEFENRALLTKYIQLGLVPFVIKTPQAKNISISLKNIQSNNIQPIVTTVDKWNYWVFNIGVNGSLNGDKVYKSTRYNGDMSARRITDKLKVTFRINGGKNETNYDFETLTGNIKYKVDNNNYSFYHQVVKSLNEHWSYGYDVNASHSTFSNTRLNLRLQPAVEYNIYPYKDVNTRYFSIRYGIDLQRSNYIDTTIYFKTKETLMGHGLNATLSFNQKWGTSSVGLNYHNYFHDWKYFNVGMNGSVNVRITGGLSFNFFAFAGLVRDQLSLSGEGATEQEVLTRRRQLASSYNYYTNFGLNYRFGSKLNNFVNPRFDGGNNFFFF